MTIINASNKIFDKETEVIHDPKVNLNKIEVIHVLDNTSETTRVIEYFGSKAGAFPLKYLGLPLQNGKLKREDCDVSSWNKNKVTLTMIWCWSLWTIRNNSIFNEGSAKWEEAVKLGVSFWNRLKGKG
ncbi:ribonuclease H protein [Canna indica]|uniref:Ribonuclease H protein n=1 Tax=Canna indica TaxID=4628 RepID=A0AAQ3QI77_9LILI|nr:ribonuclease H protein [Canna indica]